jgi:hypothetical protein
VSDLYILTIDPHAYSAAGNMWTDPGNIQIAHRLMNVEIGTEAAQFPEKEYIIVIFVAVCYFLYLLFYSLYLLSSSPQLFLLPALYLLSPSSQLFPPCPLLIPSAIPSTSSPHPLFYSPYLILPTSNPPPPPHIPITSLVLHQRRGSGSCRNRAQTRILIDLTNAGNRAKIQENISITLQPSPMKSYLTISY